MIKNENWKKHSKFKLIHSLLRLLRLVFNHHQTETKKKQQHQQIFQYARREPISPFILLELIKLSVRMLDLPKFSGVTLSVINIGKNISSFDVILFLHMLCWVRQHQNRFQYSDRFVRKHSHSIFSAVTVMTFGFEIYYWNMLILSNYKVATCRLETEYVFVAICWNVTCSYILHISFPTARLPNPTKPTIDCQCFSLYFAHVIVDDKLRRREKQKHQQTCGHNLI